MYGGWRGAGGDLRAVDWFTAEEVMLAYLQSLQDLASMLVLGRRGLVGVCCSSQGGSRVLQRALATAIHTYIHRRRRGTDEHCIKPPKNQKRNSKKGKIRERDVDERKNCRERKEAGIEKRGKGKK